MGEPQSIKGQAKESVEGHVDFRRLFNKHLFRSLVKYAAIYAVSKKAFEPLFQRKAMKAAVAAAQKVMGSHSSPLGSANMERVLHATLLGESAHRPAELMVFLSLCVTAILFDKKFPKLRQLSAKSLASLKYEPGEIDIDSFPQKVRNNTSDRAKEARAVVDAFVCDSLALWIVAICLDVFLKAKQPKGGSMRFDDKLLHFHHWISVWMTTTPLLLNRGSWFVAWIACQMESYGTAAIVLGGILRTINKAKRSPLALLRYASDLLFAVGGLNWEYTRCSGIVRGLCGLYLVAFANGRWHELHPLWKFYHIALMPLMLLMTAYWSAQTTRVVFDKLRAIVYS